MSHNISSNNTEKIHFMLKSTPPRRTFHQDMTEEERSIMQQHISYWMDNQNKGIALVFGPVLNPSAPHILTHRKFQILLKIPVFLLSHLAYLHIHPQPFHNQPLIHLFLKIHDLQY